jgi:hypothetical protein
VAFQWSSLSATLKAALDQEAFDASASSSRVLDFLRGDRSNENPSDGLRTRYSMLGDIIHSTPVYVGPPQASLTENGYSAWASASTQANRDKRVYAGANDGMLHAFDADDGNEAWAYVPSMLLGELDRLAGRPYAHHYTVDGLLAVDDVYIGVSPISTKTWHTVLVGGLGAGGKGWYGLDITNPDLDESSASGTNKKVMWEINASSDNDLGYSYGLPVITKLNDGNWYAVMGNGYNSVNGIAKLLIVNLGTGAVRYVSTGDGSTGSPNGLSAPALIDIDGNGTSDRAYAGDIDGNLWKFDLTSATPGNWAVAHSKQLYAGLSTQPITTAPSVTRHPAHGYLVLFGTGRLYTVEDIDDASVQALYGIWDNSSTPPDVQPLQAQTLSADMTYTSGDISETVRTFSTDIATMDWSTKKGWKVELPAGYRILQPTALRARRFKASLHNPVGRENYIIEVNYLTGGSPAEVIYDINESGGLTTEDNIDGNTDGDLVDREDVIAMWKQFDGIMSELTIGRISIGIDAQLLNYLQPPAQEPCTGDCSGGFQFGHVDVDTDYWDDNNAGVGAKTHKHTHEYDKKALRVYIDYLDFGTEVTGHAEIDDTDYVPSDEEWIVVVANADLNPGSTLLLGDVEYNVVDYQVMIHKLLRDWQGTDYPLVDGVGNSLIFNAAGLVATGGTVRNAFDDMSLISGGVHPTNTSCVNKNDAVTNGRYRNGSLVTQLISTDVFAADCVETGCNLDPLIVQNPTDMGTTVQLGDNRQVTMKEDFDSSSTFDASNYEIFGGLRADISGRGDTDAWYESTVFWHYGGGSCYGEDDYDADVLEVRDNLILTQEEFDQILSDLGITDLQQEIAANEYCKDTKQGQDLGDGTGRTGCADYYEELMDLIELEQTITNEDGTAINPEIIGHTTGDPYVVGGGEEALGETIGPNDMPGRRTWTDVTDD